MKIFNFELEEKLNQHFDVKFDGKSDGNRFKSFKFFLLDFNKIESAYRLRWKTSDILPKTKTLVAFLTGGNGLMLELFNALLKICDIT